MIVNVNSITELSGFHIIYNTTVKNEYDGIRGISHLIEHLMCKRFDDMLDNFEKNGISWNAYTSDTKIIFYITGLDEYLLQFKNEFIEKLSVFEINSDNFENEKKIILEEYSDTFNKQSGSHFLNLYRKLFDNYNPIGNINDIKKITIDDCLDYWNKYYKTPSKIINISKYNNFNNDLKFNSFDNNYNMNYIENNKFDLQKTNIFKSKTSVIYLSKIIEDDFPIINFTTALLSNGLKSGLQEPDRAA